MDSKQIPNYITDYINGYCKQETKSIIPLCIIKIIALYFIIHLKKTLFKIRFNYKPNYRGSYRLTPSHHHHDHLQRLTSISSTFIISNKCYKFVMDIGNNMHFEIYLSKSMVKIQQYTVEFKSTDGKEYKIDTDSNNNVKITIKINRNTQCSCLNTNGTIQLQIQQKQKSTTKNGCVELSLMENFNYNSNEKVSIETYDVQQIYSIPNKNDSMPCDKFGFGRQCCFWAAYE